MEMKRDTKGAQREEERDGLRSKSRMTETGGDLGHLIKISTFWNQLMAQLEFQPRQFISSSSISKTTKLPQGALIQVFVKPSHVWDL